MEHRFRKPLHGSTCWSEHGYYVAVHVFKGGFIHSGCRITQNDLSLIIADKAGVGGGIPKRSNGADCKSVGYAFGGSNPPPTTHASVVLEQTVPPEADLPMAGNLLA